MQDKTIGQLAD